MAQVSDEDLQRWFVQFNQQYYRGRLSRWKVIAGDPPDPDTVDVSGLCDPETKTIYVGRLSLQEAKAAQEILLHEMGHARVGGSNHGKGFKAEMKRLKDEGAPVSDLEFSEGQWVTAELVRSSIEDAMLEGLSLEQAQEWVAREYGAMSRSSLLRKYPRAAMGPGSVDALWKKYGLHAYNKFQAGEIARDLRNQGRTLREIASALTEAGYKTMRGRSYSTGAVWHLLNCGRKAE